MRSTSKHLEEIMKKQDRVANLQVVFVDVEKYSKRRTSVQISLIDEFTACLRNALTEVSQKYIEFIQKNDLNLQHDTITLPTGDGAAIIFSFEGLHDIHLTFVKALLKRVHEYSNKNACGDFIENGWCNCHSSFNVRVGISEGKGLIYRDLREGYNVAGDVVNMAARVMWAAGRNQVVFTEHARNQLIDLVDDPSLHKQFVLYPEITLKHGIKPNIYQYVEELEYLNSAPLEIGELERQLAEGKSGGRYHEIERAGFRKIYTDRQEFFKDFFERILQNIKHELKIMGICVSLFREADRPQRMVSGWNPDRVIKSLAELIDRGCMVKVLFLKRYPTTTQLEYYGIPREGDFFFMRERDEDKDSDFRRGRRLKIIANESLGYMIEVLLELARRTQHEDMEKRREILNRLQIREYIALPSLSLYISDEEIYVTPYLRKRHCSSVPAFQVGGRQSDLYIAYDAHFEATWKEQKNTSAINEKFIELLVTNPKETLDAYEKAYEVIVKQGEAIINKRAEYAEDPEYYRVQEKTIKVVLNQKMPRSVTSATPGGVLKRSGLGKKPKS